MSIFQVSNYVFINIKIDGSDIPSQSDLFEEICIIESANQVVPTLRFKLNDSQSYLMRDINISDGTKIEISISKTQTEDKTLSAYRVFSGSAIRNFSEGHYNDYSCVLDVPKYLGSAARKAIKGTTSDAVSMVASECGLTYSGDSTNDVQNWLSCGMTYNQWVRHMANHAYINDESCIYFAVTEEKSLLYKDIIRQLMNKEPVKKFKMSMNFTEKDSLISGNIFKTSSGMLNNWTNYGYLSIKDGVNCDLETYNKVTVLINEDAVTQNLAIKNLVGVARIDFFPINCTNTYPNYEKAYYQNFRLKSSFTENLSIMVYEYTGLNIFDVVEIDIGYGVLEQQRISTVVSGKYLVISKTKIMRGGTNYGERIELIRNSTRLSGSNSLIS